MSPSAVNVRFDLYFFCRLEQRYCDELTTNKKGPTSFEIGPFAFKSGSVLLFHTATV